MQNVCLKKKSGYAGKFREFRVFELVNACY